jgi:uncharacterized protein YciI
MPKIHFVCRLIAPRTSFTQDMTEKERSTMQQHQVHWRKFQADGKVLVFGPVFDPAGPYGLGVLAVDNEEQLKEFMAADPANGLLRFEWYPMKAVLHPSFPG